MNLDRQNLNGFWDDNANVPTISLDDSAPVDNTPIDTQPIYDAADAWAQGIGTPPVVSTPAPDASSTGNTGSSWSLRDILNAGRDIAQTVVQYKAATLPTGQRIYTTIDPRTGQPIYGNSTLTIGAGGITQFVNQNLPLLLLAGVGLLLITSGGSKHASRRK